MIMLLVLITTRLDLFFILLRKSAAQSIKTMLFTRPAVSFSIKFIFIQPIYTVNVQNFKVIY